MIKIKIEKGKHKTCTINPSLLLENSLAEVVSKKTKVEVEQSQIIDFDGKKVTYSDGELIELIIPEEELIDMSITQWAKKKLETRANLKISVIMTEGK